MTGHLRLALLSMLALLAVACGREQKISNPCLEEPGLCDPCHADSECVILSNSCHEYASCVPAGSDFAVNEIGCSSALEYDVPADSECVCEATVCRSADSL